MERPRLLPLWTALAKLAVCLPCLPSLLALHSDGFLSLSRGKRRSRDPASRSAEGHLLSASPSPLRFCAFHRPSLPHSLLRHARLADASGSALALPAAGISSPKSAPHPDKSLTICKSTHLLPSQNNLPRLPLPFTVSQSWRGDSVVRSPFWSFTGPRSDVSHSSSQGI